MRITNGMLIGNMMNNMYGNLGRLNNVNNQVSSGKQFTLPSENPIGVSKSMRFHTDLNKLSQYNKNLGDADSWLATTEDSLAQMNEVVKRVRDLALQASNETNTGQELKAIAPEIEQSKQQIVKAANATYAGRYIFTGFKTDVPLLDDAGNYKLTNYKSKVTTEISGNQIDVAALDFTTKPLSFDIKLGDNKTTINITGTYADVNALKTDINAQLLAGTPAATGITVDVADVAGSKGRLIFKAPAGEQSIVVEKSTLGDIETIGIKDSRFPLKQTEKSIYNLGVADDIDVNTVGIRLFGKASFDDKGKLIDEPNYLADSVNGYAITDDLSGSSSNVQHSDKSYFVSVMQEFQTALENNDRETVKKTIQRMDGIQQNILQAQAEIGAKIKRLELTQSRMGDEKINFTKLMSENEDADMMETYMQLKIEENVYNASLSAGAKVIQPTLLDFIR